MPAAWGILGMWMAFPLGFKHGWEMLVVAVLYGGAILTGGLIAALPYLWSQLEPGKH